MAISLPSITTSGSMQFCDFFCHLKMYCVINLLISNLFGIIKSYLQQQQQFICTQIWYNNNKQNISIKDVEEY